MQTDLSALIERVESGMGYDRQLEIDIWVALGWSHEKRGKDRKPWLYPAADGSTIVRRDPGDVVWWRLQHMDITESLDAVLSLIEAKLPEITDNSPADFLAGCIDEMMERGWRPGEPNGPQICRAALSGLLRAIQESRT